MRIKYLILLMARHRLFLLRNRDDVFLALLPKLVLQINNGRKERNINPFHHHKEEVRTMGSFHRLQQKWQQTNILLPCYS